MVYICFINYMNITYEYIKLNDMNILYWYIKIKIKYINVYDLRYIIYHILKTIYNIYKYNKNLPADFLYIGYFSFHFKLNKMKRKSISNQKSIISKTEEKSLVNNFKSKSLYENSYKKTKRVRKSITTSFLQDSLFLNESSGHDYDNNDNDINNSNEFKDYYENFPFSDNSRRISDLLSESLSLLVSHKNDEDSSLTSNFLQEMKRKNNENENEIDINSLIDDLQLNIDSKNKTSALTSSKASKIISGTCHDYNVNTNNNPIDSRINKNNNINKKINANKISVPTKSNNEYDCYDNNYDINNFNKKDSNHTKNNNNLRIYDYQYNNSIENDKNYIQSYNKSISSDKKFHMIYDHQKKSIPNVICSNNSFPYIVNMNHFGYINNYPNEPNLIYDYNTYNNYNFYHQNISMHPYHQALLSNINLFFSKKIEKRENIFLSEYEFFLKNNIILIISNKDISKNSQKSCSLFENKVKENVLYETLPLFSKEFTKRNVFCDYFLQRFFKYLSLEQRLYAFYNLKPVFLLLAKDKTGIHLILSLLSKANSNKEYELISESVERNLNHLCIDENASKIILKFIMKYYKDYDIRIIYENLLMNMHLLYRFPYLMNIYYFLFKSIQLQNSNDYLPLIIDYISNNFNKLIATQNGIHLFLVIMSKSCKLSRNYIDKVILSSSKFLFSCENGIEFLIVIIIKLKSLTLFEKIVLKFFEEIEYNSNSKNNISYMSNRQYSNSYNKTHFQNQTITSNDDYLLLFNNEKIYWIVRKTWLELSNSFKIRLEKELKKLIKESNQKHMQIFQKWKKFISQ